MADYGFIREKIDIKFLILFVMSNLECAVSFDDVVEMAMVDSAMNYFDVSDAFYEMVDSGHVAQVDEFRFVITEKGRGVLPGYEMRLPASVRRDAQKAIMRTVARLKRESMITVYTEKEPSGQLMTTLKMCDDKGEIMRLSLLVVNPKLGTILETNFKANAELIYNGVLNAVLRDYSAGETRENEATK